MTPISLAQHELVLLPGRGVYRPGTGTLYVADVHIGKASAFAKGGIPLSAGLLERSAVADLERLTRMLTQTGAARLVILGDLLHAPAGRDPRTMELLARWRASHDRTEVLLVRGNHDLAAGDPPCEARIACVDEPFDDCGITLVHYPRAVPTGQPTLAGHLHPSVVLTGIGDRARVACFWVSQGQLVLPAFGNFTGNASVKPGAGDRVFAVADGALFEVPLGQLHSAALAR